MKPLPMVLLYKRGYSPAVATTLLLQVTQQMFGHKMFEFAGF